MEKRLMKSHILCYGVKNNSSVARLRRAYSVFAGVMPVGDYLASTKTSARKKNITPFCSITIALTFIIKWSK